MSAVGANGESRAIRRRLIGFTIAVLALINGGAGVWVWTERQEAIRVTSASMINTSRLLASAVDSELGAIDRILVGAAEVVRVRSETRARENPAILDFLNRQVAQAPAARAILVTDAQGKTVYATNRPDPYGAVDLSDRPYFQRHRDARSNQGFLGAPMASRNDGVWIVALSRRLEDANGAFAGVVAATIDLGHLAATMRLAAPTAADSATLIAEDGAILARVPDHDKFVGRSLAGMPAFQAGRDQATGSGVVVSPLDWRERLFGNARGRTFPLIAVTSREMDAVLGEWHMQSALLGGAAFIVSLIVLALTFRLLRQLRQVDSAMADLADARQVADAANQAKSAFLANMSHEFRTPLNAILGFSDALISGLPGHRCQSVCQDYLGHVQSSGQHLLALVGDILDLSKIEAGKAALEREPVEIGPLVGDCVTMLGPKAKEKGIDLSLEDAGPAAPVMVDSRRLRQIMLNLLSNALKFTPSGGSVRVAVGETGTEVVISVADTGIGMTPDEVVTALTPFGQNPSDLARAEAGAGLGLPLSARLAELHGGRLDVESAKGAGTSVSIRLPKR